MKTYEITFITKEEPKESSVKATLETFGGRILNISSLGQKTFVYPISKEKAGFYTTYLFEMEAEKIQDFNRKLSQDDEILRHLIISIKPSEEMAGLPVKLELEIEEKPETEIVIEEKAIEPEPEKSLDKVADEETAVTEEPAEEKVEEPVAEVKAEPKKEVKKTVKKAATQDLPEKEVKTKKVEKETKTGEPVEDEEERLEALDKKLEELLKD